ncbi:MAG: nickel pincer cofactor biosynthesis protein LarC [Deltaproteobacteria bacterium]|nr:nickel pincer cofactor biosynthesis protein LarC [Deltaproteobacteria bacterium]
MSRTIYLDCVGGLAGDMLLAALIDVGADASRLHALPARLGFDDVRIEIEAGRSGGFAARRVKVLFDAKAHLRHRGPREIAELIGQAGLDEEVARWALAIFEELARAEAAVHGADIQEVHFHEVGAVDALVDIVGVCELLASLDVERVICSTLPMGRGFVDCAHGRLPLPAPAVAAMLEGVPVRDAGIEGETVTPTGLAVVRGLGASFGPMPSLHVRAMGVGAGTRENPGELNILRVFVGDIAAKSTDSSRAADSSDVQLMVETTLDDLDPRLLPELLERIMEAGALDVHVAPVITKKGRAAQLVRALTRVETKEAVVSAFYRHSTTLGLRLFEVEKRSLARRSEKVQTCFGEAEVKVALEGGEPLRCRAEYEVCVGLARQAGVSVMEVIAAAEAAWMGE